MKQFQQKNINQYGQNVGVNLNGLPATDVQEKDLIGTGVNLRCLNRQPISEVQLCQLWDAVLSEPDHRCWTYLPYSAFQSQADLKVAVDHLFGFHDSIHYLIEVNQHIVGWVALLNIRSQSRVVEIGNVYFSHQMKQSTAATETIYLLLRESLKQGFRRVEWKCDDLNQASKSAALRYGFKFEGIFRQDRITKGRNRNTAWFSMLDEEWIALEKAYQAWLSNDNFDQNQQQKTKLIDFIKHYAQ